MKEINKSLLDKAIVILNKLGIENKDIMILGSIALDIIGLFPLNRHQAHDVDVMIKCTEEKEKQITELSKLLESISNKKTSSDNSSIILNVNNVIINIWFVRPEYNFNTMIKLENGIWVEKPIDCIKKKKQFGRIKDYQDIRNIIFQII